MYILFSSIFSTVVDVVRLLLWSHYLLSYTIGYINSLGVYYIMLLAFGGVLKFVGGIFAFFLVRAIREKERGDAMLRS